jgi:2-methylcitrate dehydratase PrpD
MKRSIALSRRRLLQSAGSLVAAGAWPWTRAAAAAPQQAGEASGGAGISPAMSSLSAYIAAAVRRMLPADVVEHTALHVLDTIAAMVSGTRLPPGAVAIRFARMYAEPTATVAGTTLLCGPIEAAFVNAMLAHADETDDSHAPSQSHPGCAIVPAALAVGEQFGISGAAFVRAVAAGYDVGTRFTMTLGAGAFQTETRISTHALASLFGAAAASAAAASLDPRQARWVLDYASQQASGIKAWQRDVDHIEKAFVFAGVGARSGVTATELVHAGATGVDDVLSGADSFLSVYGPHADAGRLVEKLGERYEVVRTNIKKWTVGSPIQAPLDALETLIKRRGLKAADVRRVTVRVATSEAALVNDREMPDICMQHMVAVMLLDGTASFAAAHDRVRMDDPAVRALRAKVRLTPDAALEAELPKRIAIVDVDLNDGRTLTERVDAVRGTAENPMTRAEVVAKCRDLMAPVLGAPQTDRLIEALLTIDGARDVRALRPLLQTKG